MSLAMKKELESGRKEPGSKAGAGAGCGTSGGFPKRHLHGDLNHRQARLPELGGPSTGGHTWRGETKKTADFEVSPRAGRDGPRSPEGVRLLYTRVPGPPCPVLSGNSGGGSPSCFSSAPPSSTMPTL